MEGTGFGIRVEGLLDGAAVLLRRGSDVCDSQPENKELHDACKMFVSAWVGKRIWSPLCRQIANGGGGELSPSGVCSAVCAIIVATEKLRSVALQLLMETEEINTLSTLLGLLEPNNITRIYTWPRQEIGGGSRSRALLGGKDCGNWWCPGLAGVAGTMKLLIYSDPKICRTAHMDFH